jgi:hypothetical protein
VIKTRRALVHTGPMPLLGKEYARFESRIRRLPSVVTDKDLVGEKFRLNRDGKLEIYYAPVDWLRPHARLAIVGITPGRDTMRIAYQTVVDGLAAGKPRARVLDEVKVQASFSGFRPLLSAWLLWLGAFRHLGLEDVDDPWRSGARLIQPTSAVRYPVFIDGTNYSGRNPDLVRHPLLRRYLVEVLAPELARIPLALIVPLGDKVSEALQVLADDELIDLNRCLVGFPHPSGNNGYRMIRWAEHRRALKRKTANWFASHPLASR